MILVTGGTGLVGSHLLLHLLENNEPICAIYRNKKSIQKTKSLFLLYNKASLFKKINWIAADINDIPSLEIAFKNIEFVYHCAALISFDPKDENLIRKINIEGTANIVNFSISNQIKKLCYVSSIAALGDLKENEKIITEETHWDTEKLHSDYAISKYGAEMEIWRGMQEGLNVVIVNPGIILGIKFNEQGKNTSFIEIKKSSYFYTKGSSGFITVLDVVTIMHQLMTKEINGERFILVSENKPFKDVLNLIAIYLKRKKPFLYVNPFLLNIIWRLDWILSTIFRKKRKLSKYIAKTLNKNTLFSNDKIKSTLSYNFLNIDLYFKALYK